MSTLTSRIVPVATLALVALSVLPGCSSSGITVTGAFGSRQLHVAGTGIGWIDATQFVPDSGTGTPVIQDRTTDQILMHLVFTEAVFDPQQDLRALPAGERQAIFEDIARGDRLAADIRRGNVIRPGDDIELVRNDGSLPPEVLPFLSSVGVTLGTPTVTTSDRYPDRATRVGSDLKASLAVTGTSPELVGALTVEAKKAATEGDGFLEGKVTVHFAMELLPERQAECNFAPQDEGVVSPCDLSDNLLGPGASPIPITAP